MAKKKIILKKVTKAKSAMEKIGEKVGTLAGKITTEKNHLVQIAGGALESVKEAIHDIGAKKKAAPEKAAKKSIKAANKVVKKTVKPVAKKATKAKQAVKKSIKKTAKKTSKKQ